MGITNLNSRAHDGVWSSREKGIFDFVLFKIKNDLITKGCTGEVECVYGLSIWPLLIEKDSYCNWRLVENNL